ncbi:MAG: hypothetical protein JJU36_00380 [Phycisphaeraceae bacterium]|nr:hypothetical protein [Phycisphaeraceae bacterium]
MIPSVNLHRFVPVLLLVLIGHLSAAFALAAEGGAVPVIWHPGQATASSTFQPHGWYDSVQRGELVGGAWASHFSDQGPGQVSYRLTVPRDGRYHFWLRANPVRSALRFRLGDGPWRDVDFQQAIDRRNIAADGALDLRFVAWVRLGRFDLSRGPLEVTFEARGDHHHHGGIDALFVSTSPIQPIGNERPDPTQMGESMLDEDRTWPFMPMSSDKAERGRRLLDLRSLNESEAGRHGFIRRSEDGEGFVRGDGRPIRFWAVGSDLYRGEPEAMEVHVRFLARLGVNMVRLHANIADTRPGAKLTDVNQAQIDGIHRFVAAARREGIYVTISPFWAHIRRVPESWEIEGYPPGSHLWGVMFIDQRLENAYRGWLRKLLVEPNPHTGVALKDDPAVAILQVKNEDSLLFWTFQGIAEAHRKRFESRFTQWAVARYGSLPAALAAWDGYTFNRDDQEAGHLGLHDTWHQTQRWRGGKAKRLADELEFIAGAQRDFYARTHRFLREELGCKQLINAMNWKSADPVLLDDVERWTYLPAEVIAVNRYTGVVHVGENHGYRIDPGHHFQSRSVLRDPASLPMALKRPAGRPMLITESTWVHPTQWQSEGPFLTAAYLSLTGVNALYWFSATEPEWLTDPRRLWWQVGDSHALHKWSCSVPMLMGQFPAHALAFRRGDLEQGRPVVEEHRSREDLWNRRIPIISESGSYDPNRDADHFPAESPVDQPVDRRAFLVGPVRVHFDSDASESQVADLSPYILDNGRQVRSNTGQIGLDSARGVLVVDSPRYKGVSGFLAEAGGRFELTDLVIESGNRYASIALVALDELPLTESRRILVQVGTEARLTGWQTRKSHFEVRNRQISGERIINTGRPPWRIANTEAELVLRNPHLRRATALDVDGFAADRPIRARGGSDGFEVELPPDAMYVLLTAEE